MWKVVKTLRKRIREHGSELQHETRTRQVLVDPLLRALGWDVADPEQVTLEFLVRVADGVGYADYALRVDGDIKVIVETKSFNTELDLKVLRQGLNYCQKGDIPYLATTNGIQWNIYETRGEKLSSSFDVEKDSVTEVCKKALDLPTLAAEQVTVELESPDPQPTPLLKTTTIPTDDADWQPFPAAIWDTESKLYGIRFPDGSKKDINYWREAVQEITEWLIDAGHFDYKQLPIKSGKTGRGKIFIDKERFDGADPVKDLFVRSDNNLENTVKMIDDMGQAPDQFKILFAKG